MGCLALSLRAAVCCRTVKIDGAQRRVQRFHPLCGESGQHAGEDISAAASGQSGVSGGIAPEFALRRGDEGAVFFQDDDTAVFLCVIEGDLFSSRLDISDAAAAQPRHLAGMGRDDDPASRQRRRQFFIGGYSVEGVCVQDYRAVCAGDEDSDEGSGAFGISHARPEEESGVIIFQFSLEQPAFFSEIPPTRSGSQHSRMHSGSRG